MATEQVVLNTERLVLRAWTIKDALAALTIFGRDEVSTGSPQYAGDSRRGRDAGRS